MNTKQIKNYLIIDWRNETTRTRATEPNASDLGTNEVVAPISVDVVIPEVEVDELTARVEVPKPRVEEIELADVDADGVTDWEDVADEYLGVFEETYECSWETWETEESDFILQIIQDAPGRPDVEEVRAYCNDEMADRLDGVEVV